MRKEGDPSLEINDNPPVSSEEREEYIDRLTEDGRGAKLAQGRNQSKVEELKRGEKIETALFETKEHGPITTTQELIKWMDGNRDIFNYTVFNSQYGDVRIGRVSNSVHVFISEPNYISTSFMIDESSGRVTESNRYKSSRKPGQVIASYEYFDIPFSVENVLASMQIKKKNSSESK